MTASLGLSIYVVIDRHFGIHAEASRATGVAGWRGYIHLVWP